MLRGGAGLRRPLARGLAADDAHPLLQPEARDDQPSRPRLLQSHRERAGARPCPRRPRRSAPRLVQPLPGRSPRLLSLLQYPGCREQLRPGRRRWRRRLRRSDTAFASPFVVAAGTATPFAGSALTAAAGSLATGGPDCRAAAPDRGQQAGRPGEAAAVDRLHRLHRLHGFRGLLVQRRLEPDAATSGRTATIYRRDVLQPRPPDGSDVRWKSGASGKCADYAQLPPDAWHHACVQFVEWG